MSIVQNVNQEMVKVYRVLIGPWFLSLMLNWFYFGANCIQMHDYWTVTQKGDTWRIRLYAYAVFGLAFVQTLFVTVSAWDVVIMNWGGPDPFNLLPYTAVVLPAVNALVAFVVQVWFAWRIYELSKKRDMAVKWRTICCIIGALSLAQLGTSTGVVAMNFAIGRHPRQWYRTYPIFGVWMGTTITCDMLVATSLYLMLVRERKGTEEKGIRYLLDLFVTCYMETGYVIASFGALILILFYTCHTNYIHFVPLSIIGRLYSNVHLATLNARKRKNPNDPTLSAPQFSQIIFARDPNSLDTRAIIPMEELSGLEPPPRSVTKGDDSTEASSFQDDHTASSSKGLGCATTRNDLPARSRSLASARRLAYTPPREAMVSFGV